MNMLARAGSPNDLQTVTGYMHIVIGNLKDALQGRGPYTLTDFIAGEESVDDLIEIVRGWEDALHGNPSTADLVALYQTIDTFRTDPNGSTSYFRHDVAGGITITEAQFSSQVLDIENALAAAIGG
jgi:hypothetical protein